MKEHIIKRTGKKGSGDAYTTFKNPDEQLRKEIAEYDPEITVYRSGWPSKEWTIDVWEEKEVKCIDGRNTMFFPRKDVEQFILEEKERLRNKKYQAYKYFTKCFGVISNFGTQGEYAHLKKVDLQNAMSLGALVGAKGEIDTMSVEAYDKLIEYSINPYYGLTFELRNGGSLLNLYFDKNGDFVNRDYNEDFSEYICEDIPVKNILDLVLNKLEEIPDELDYYRGKYYSSEICYVPDANADKGKVHLYYAKVKFNGTYQISSGWSIYKKPKGTEKRTKQDLINDMKKLFKETLNLDL